MEAVHGRLGQGKGWFTPRLVARSQQLARPGYSRIRANEFVDEEFVMEDKIKLTVEMIRHSDCVVAYTGAGISRAAGIADYASKAKKSIAGEENKSLNRLRAIPTKTHRVLVAMQKKGLLKYWVQQNHDGLAQKAGFPLSKLNQIHGSWFDRKNPVVLMDDCLKKDNLIMLQKWQNKVDVCLALGTSLSGMRSDGIVKRGKLIIINLQQTPYDEECCLHIYGDLQEVMGKIAKKLHLNYNSECCLPQNQWIK